MLKSVARRLLGDEKGNILMMATAALPVLIGAAGLATDTVQWTLWKRQLQREADSAALSGAYAVAQGFGASASATAEINRMALVSLSATPTVENAPTTGSYAGNAKAVRVALQTSQALPFTRLLGIPTPVIVAEATAAVVSEGEYCVVALDGSTTVGVTLQGNATVNLGCGIMSNSKGSNGVSAGGSSTVTATPVAAVGGLQASSNYVSPTTLQPYSLPQPDPYSGLPVPAPSGCSGKVSVNPQGSRSIGPGCYRGIDVKGTLNMSPGVYYIDGSSFSVGSQGVVTGTGVTIILTSENAATNPSSIASADINGGATMNLSAPTSGTYAGMILYQDRRAQDSGSNKINGNAASFLQGSLYFPSQLVEFTGTSGMSTDCLKIVAKRVTFTGNNSVNNNCPANSGNTPITGTRVRLVG